MWPESFQSLVSAPVIEPVSIFSDEYSELMRGFSWKVRLTSTSTGLSVETFSAAFISARGLFFFASPKLPTKICTLHGQRLRQK